MRILFLTHFFPPEIGAPQTRILETARSLQARGHEVMVLTAFPNYPSGVVPPAYRGRRLMREEIGGVTVVRSWLYAAPNRGFGRRILNHTSFAVSALFGARSLPARPQVIAVDMHPIFLCFAAYLLGRRWRAPYVINAGDLIPEQAVAFGALSNPVAIGLTRRLRDFVCRRAAMIVPFTRGIGDALVGLGVPPERVQLIHYGADVEIFQRPDSWLPLQPELVERLRGRFVVMYAGTHGLGQGLEMVLAAAEELREDGEVLFLLVGDGSEKPRLVEDASHRGLANVLFLDPVPHAMMPSLYRLAGASLVSLKPIGFLALMGLPSKLFEVMASGCPAIVAAAGEPAAIANAAGAGLVVPPGDVRGLVRAISELRRDRPAARAMGARGRTFVTERVSRGRQTDLYEAVLARAVGAGGEVALA